MYCILFNFIVQFLKGERIFLFPLHPDQLRGPPASYRKDTGGSLPMDKVAGA
jgi:hypothetical protein